MSTLQCAVAFVQCDHVAVGIGEDLDLNVAGTLDVALHKDGAIAECGHRFALCAHDGVRELVGVAHDAHASATATSRRLHQRGQSNIGKRLNLVVRSDWNAMRAHQLLGFDLATHRRDRRWRRPNPHQTSVEHLLRKRRVLGQEPVARMTRIGASAQGSGDDQVATEVRVGRRRARQTHGDVGFAREWGISVGVAEHGDGRDRLLAASTHDATGDLAAICNKD